MPNRTPQLCRARTTFREMLTELVHHTKEIFEVVSVFLARLLLIVSIVFFSGCDHSMKDHQNSIEFSGKDWVGKPYSEFKNEYGSKPDLGSGIEVYYYEIGGETYSVSVSNKKIESVKKAGQNERQ